LIITWHFARALHNIVLHNVSDNLMRYFVWKNAFYVLPTLLNFFIVF